MKTILTILLIIALAVIGYKLFVTDNPSEVGAQNNILESSSGNSPLPLKIFIAADATGSLRQNGISFLTTNQLTRVVDAIKVPGGQVALLIVNANCGRTPLLRLSIPKEPKRPFYPVHVVSQTAFQYGQILQQYQKSLKQYLLDSTNYSTVTVARIDQFLREAGILLHNSYTHLANNSDCIGAINVSTKYQSEPVRNNQNIRKVSIFISDMVHAAPGNQNSLIIPEGSVSYFVVRTRKVKDCFPEGLYYEEFESIDPCLDDILHQ